MPKVYAQIIVVALIALAGACAGWGINGWRLKSDVEKAKAEFSEAKAAAYEQALKDIKQDMERMATAAEDARVVTADIDRAMDKIAKELKHAKPLPVDCRPDDFRMRALSKAVAELQSTLAGSKPSGSMQDLSGTGRR